MLGACLHAGCAHAACAGVGGRNEVLSIEPLPGWTPDPPMVGIRSPICLVVGSCTSHPGVLGSIPKREGKQADPILKHRVPHGSQPSLGGLQIPKWLGSDPLLAWWLGLAPVTLEFWVRFPNERNQGKPADPMLKSPGPHGSQARPGWAPDPQMVRIRSPIGLVVGSCTSHPGVLGSIPKREEARASHKDQCSMAS